MMPTGARKVSYESTGNYFCSDAKTIHSGQGFLVESFGRVCLPVSHWQLKVDCQRQ
jgi:hypothetical protein